VQPLADASVDSFNDHAHATGGWDAVPGWRLQAESIENHPDHPGVYIAVDDGDKDNDGIPGFADGFDLDGEAQTADDEYEDELMPLYQLVLSYPVIPNVTPRIRLDYPASYKLVNESGIVVMDANANWPTTPYVLPNDQPLRIWMGAGSSRTAAQFVLPDTEYTSAQLGAVNGEITLYMQGVSPGQGTIRYYLDVDGNGPAGFVLADEVKFSAAKVDLAIDSLNTAGFAVPGTGQSAEVLLRDQLEADPGRPGKAICVNDNDDDGVLVDWADGFNWDGREATADDGPARTERFVPLTITLPEPLDLSKVRLQLQYDASDPSAITRTAPPAADQPRAYSLPAAGFLRIWTKDGSAARYLDPFYALGNYVPPRAADPLESDDSTGSGPYDPWFYGPGELMALGFSAWKRTVTLYVEAVRPGDGLITVRVDPDGEGPARFMLADAVKVTAFRMSLESVTFNATDARRFFPVLRDSTGTAYTASGPHWRADPAQMYPVAYRRGATMLVTAQFAFEGWTPPQAIAVSGKVQWAWEFYGRTGWRDPKDYAHNLTELSGSTLTLVDAASRPFANAIVFLESMEIEWRISLDGGANYVHVGTSANPTYVTLERPIGPAYHTLLHLGCRNAPGAKTARSAVEYIWKEFTDLDVRRADGVRMKYWHNNDATATTTAELLADANANGQCGAWAEFFRDMLRAQGIAGAVKVELTPIRANDPGTYDPADHGFQRGLMLVKHWTFNATGTAPSNAAPYTHLLHEVQDGVGVAGQGNPNPPGAFYNHFIVKYDDKYYDPSYGGGPFRTKEQWEDNSLDGFSILVSGSSSELRVAKRNTRGLETLFIART